MSVYLKDGEVLLDGGFVATSPDCCCGATGACCIGGACSILSGDDCASGGGHYLGDDSTCDGADCTHACCNAGGGFGAFDGSGRRFLTKTEHYTRTAHTEPIPGEDGCDLSEDITTVTTIDPFTCNQTVACFGTLTYVNITHPDLEFSDCSWVSDGSGGCHFVFIDGAGGLGCGVLCVEGCTGCTPATINATTQECSSSRSVEGNTCSEEHTITLSDECISTGACCTDGTCAITTHDECTGTYHGDDSTCEGVDCTMGACCLEGPPTFHCISMPSASCTGTFAGFDSSCSEPTGCCQYFDPDGGTCAYSFDDKLTCCGIWGGTSLGFGNCFEERGACKIDPDCFLMSADQCACNGGTFCGVGVHTCVGC